jgi:polysaccharide biosynthesis protein PslF
MNESPQVRQDRSLHVCLLSAEYPPDRGGVGDYTRLLAGELARGGLAVSIVTGKRTQPVAGHLPNVALHPAVGDWGYACWRQVLGCLREVRPDVLHIQYQTAAYGMHPATNLLPWRLRASGFSGRIVTTFHDLRPPYLFPKAGELRHLAALGLAAGSHAVVLVAREHWQATPLAWLRRLQPGLAGRTYIIPIGSNIPSRPPAGYDRQAWRANLLIAPEDLVLVFFGFLNDSKGGDDLLGTLASLRNRGHSAKLLMVGGDGESNAVDEAWRQRFEQDVVRLGLSGCVLRTGFAAEGAVSGHLLAGDICVLPFRDGATFQRGSLLAALAHGLPTVSTRSPGPEARSAGLLPQGWSGEAVLQHGDNIWLVSPQRPDDLANAVERLAADRGLRACLGEGAKRLSALLTWPAIAERHRQLYSALVAGADRSAP